jgi:pyrimidine oxygenase
VILDDTDAAALAKVAHYNAGADAEALANQRGHYAADATGTSSPAVAAQIRTDEAIDPGSPSFFIGSPRTVAERLNRLATVGGLEAVLFDFDDFGEGLDRFGAEVLPLLDFDHRTGDADAVG